MGSKVQELSLETYDLLEAPALDLSAFYVCSPWYRWNGGEKTIKNPFQHSDQIWGWAC